MIEASVTLFNHVPHLVIEDFVVFKGYGFSVRSLLRTDLRLREHLRWETLKNICNLTNHGEERLIFGLREIEWGSDNT
jgi:hypothetical protein